MTPAWNLTCLFDEREWPAAHLRQQDGSCKQCVLRLGSALEVQGGSRALLLTDDPEGISHPSHAFALSVLVKL
jgi:hypothetical protein